MPARHEERIGPFDGTRPDLIEKGTALPAQLLVRRCGGIVPNVTALNVFGAVRIRLANGYDDSRRVRIPNDAIDPESPPRAELDRQEPDVGAHMQVVPGGIVAVRVDSTEIEDH
jgi:hypothetical protein